MNTFKIVRSAACEFLAMMIFVYTCTGTAAVLNSANSPGGKVFQIALTFGFAIVVLAYVFGHHSGAHVNCAVTFGLLLCQAVQPVEAVAIFVGQIFGSIFGALLVAGTVSEANDATGNLGSNAIPDHAEVGEAFLGETVMTFVLMLTVLEAAVSNHTLHVRGFAPIAIGFAVFLGHCLLIPLDGCSINPTRTIGPAIVAAMLNRKTYVAKPVWTNMWVFWVAPLLGAAIAAGIHKVLTFLADKIAEEEQPVEPQPVEPVMPGIQLSEFPQKENTDKE